jgi:hypothetical protein
MTAANTAVFTQRKPELLGQIVILTGRNPARLKQAALELHAQRTADFDANNLASLQSFFQDLPTPIDHVMVTPGAPHYKAESRGPA